MELSIKRHTEKHKVKVAVQKKRRRWRRDQDSKMAKDKLAEYKSVGYISQNHFGESTDANERERRRQPRVAAAVAPAAAAALV
jgi:hypothetical protein